MKKNLILLIIFLMPFVILAQDYNYSEIKTNQLPEKTKTYISKNMPDGTIERAAKGTDQGKTVYAAIIDVDGNKRIMIFDEQGNFLRRANSLDDPGNSENLRGTGPDPNNTSNTRPHPTLAPTTMLEKDQIPPAILDYLNKQLNNFQVLQAKQVTLGTAPSYQLIIRDATHDYVYFFNSKGEFTNRRSYTHNKSPFKSLFPLTDPSSSTPNTGSEENK